jgi:hypothetical protein
MVKTPPCRSPAEEGSPSHRASHEKEEKTMWGLIVIQWLHVLLGIFWFGSTLYLDVVIFHDTFR